LGVALFHIVAFVILFHILAKFFEVFELPEGSSAFTVSLFACAPSLGSVVIWKAAGASLVLSVIGLMLWLLIFIRGVKSDRPLSRKEGLTSVAALVLCVFSSSLITAPLAFLVAFLPMCKKQLRSFIYAGLASVAMSALYFVIRNRIIAIPLPPINEPALDPVLRMVGSFLKTDIGRSAGTNTLAIWGIAGLLVLTVCTVLHFFSSSPAIRQRGSLAAFGVLAIVVSILQVYIGRGMWLAQLSGERYYFFPLIGFTCCIACGIALLPLEKRGRWWCITSVFLVSLFVGRLNEARYETSEVRAVHAARSRFFKKLEAVLCATWDQQPVQRFPGYLLLTLPDFPMSDCKGQDEMKIQAPFQSGEHGFYLSYYARAIGSSCFDSTMIRFVPMKKVRGRHLNLVLNNGPANEFYREYFPRAFR